MTQAIKERALSIPLPRFGRQPIDDLLPDSATLTPPATDDPTSGHLPRETSSHPPATDGPDASPPLPPALTPGPRTLTGTSGTSSPRGDAKTAGEVVAGLIGILCAVAFTWAARRSWHFRQPTEPEIESVAVPLGKIAARHLPTDAIAPDLIDATRAVKGAHSYVLAGPIFTRYPAEPSGDELP